MINNKIILRLKFLLKIFLFAYFIVYQTLKPTNSDNITKVDSQVQYFFPKLLEIRRFMKIRFFEKYIKDCKNKKNFNRNKIKKEFPFLSVCICTFNSEKYVENAILSILNQSFQDFEIIIINDFSNDETFNIINQYKDDERFKIINHTKNFGIYRSRVDAIINSKGNYILFVDSDDMILNEYLFEILFFYVSIYKFDIIEFLVLHQIEGNNHLYQPLDHVLTHIHNYSESIIYQPELSTTIFYSPQTKNFSTIICRNLWNKIYKKEILLNSIKYIGEKFYLKSYLNYGEDTIMNILNFYYANNYTNINLYGYMYNVRNDSISRFTNDIQKRRVLNLGIYYYIKFLYKYIKEFNIDRELLYLELDFFNKQILFIKKNDSIFFKKRVRKLLKEIIKDNESSVHIKKYLKKLIKIKHHQKNK